jgi:hypothetical protein
MSPAACNNVRLLLAVTVAALGASSTAEARHWRFHWHYNNGFSQETDEARGEDTALRAFGRYRSRVEAGAFNRGIKQMVGACVEQAVALRTIPFDLVSRTVQANDAQRSALEQVRSTANDAATTLSASCPKDIHAELGQRLHQLGRALSAVAASLAALRPALATFYDALGDEQKARLVALDNSRSSLSKLDPGGRWTANDGASDDGSKRDPVCRQWVTILRSWPIAQVERAISLSDEQHANLYDLSAAIYRAAGSLATACAGDNHFTAIGRLEAKQQQLQALQQGIDAIKPVLSKFEDSLTDSQRTRLAIAING